MKNEIFLSDDLQKIVDRNAAEIGITTSAYLADLLTTQFKDELNNVPDKSYAQLYSELKIAVINYKNGLNVGDKFTLRDVPYYRDLSHSRVNGTHTIPSGLRARLGRSINADIRLSGDINFADVKRATTKNGKPAFKKDNGSNAAVYEKF